MRPQRRAPSVPHFVFHVMHIEPYPLVDAVALLMIVGSLVVVPVVLLLLTRRETMPR